MTEQEQQELEMLRKEKRQRTQQQRAQAALEVAGVPASFAALLAGEDDNDTDRRAKDFCAAYQAAGGVTTGGCWGRRPRMSSASAAW